MTESLKVEMQWKMQVRESDQLSYPVRQVASLDMVPERTPCPPADGKEKQFKRIPVTTRGTHTSLKHLTFSKVVATHSDPLSHLLFCSHAPDPKTS